MMYSKELKAMVTAESILSGIKIKQDHCHTVQQFDYCCLRKRNVKGEAYGPAEPVELTFSIRLNNALDAKAFYERLADCDHFAFSFVFNAVFDDDSYLKSYEDGMVCDGYVVSVAEDFSTSKMDDEPNDEQMLLTVKLLLVGITYLGVANNHHSIFIQ